jgi:hypothetical protein
MVDLRTLIICKLIDNHMENLGEPSDSSKEEYRLKITGLTDQALLYEYDLVMRDVSRRNEEWMGY